MRNRLQTAICTSTKMPVARRAVAPAVMAEARMAIVVQSQRLQGAFSFLSGVASLFRGGVVASPSVTSSFWGVASPSVMESALS